MHFDINIFVFYRDLSESNQLSPLKAKWTVFCSNSLSLHPCNPQVTPNFTFPLLSASNFLREKKIYGEKKGKQVLAWFETSVTQRSPNGAETMRPSLKNMSRTLHQPPPTVLMMPTGQDSSNQKVAPQQVWRIWIFWQQTAHYDPRVCLLLSGDNLQQLIFFYFFSTNLDFLELMWESTKLEQNGGEGGEKGLPIDF